MQNDTSYTSNNSIPNPKNGQQMKYDLSYLQLTPKAKKTKQSKFAEDKHMTVQQLMNRCAQAQMCVEKFKNEVEFEVTLHGSFKNGSFTMDSDIDLVSGVPIIKIQNILSECMSTQVLVNKSENRRMSRLILFDSYQGFQLDIVEFKDDLTRQTCFLKDKIVQLILSYDPVVIQCVWHIKKWQRMHSKQLDTTKGFPNNQILTIMLFFIMMKMEVVPPLRPDLEFDTESFLKAKHSVLQILNTFFEYLSNPFNFEPVCLVRDEKWRSDGRNWLIIEPSTNTPFQTMRGDIPHKLAILAKSFFTEGMATELERDERITMGEDRDREQDIHAKMSRKDSEINSGGGGDRSQIECQESKMKEVVSNLRNGNSVIKSLTDKNKKKNVIMYIKTSLEKDENQNELYQSAY